MMGNMLLTEGQPVTFTSVSLPKGNFVKLQPVTSDFLDIHNPKAVLERALRSYSCLTVGDCFVVHYNNRDYEIEVGGATHKGGGMRGKGVGGMISGQPLQRYSGCDRGGGGAWGGVVHTRHMHRLVPHTHWLYPTPCLLPCTLCLLPPPLSPTHPQVREVKPGTAVSIIETDVNLEFEAPKDYKEPVPQPAAARAQPSLPAAGAAADGQAGTSGAGAAAEAAEPEEPKFVPFVGSGRRLDGKASSSSSSPAAAGPSSAAAAAAAARAGGGGAVGGAKPGTFVSTGNRLLDKLEMDKVGGWCAWAGEIGGENRPHQQQEQQEQKCVVALP